MNRDGQYVELARFKTLPGVTDQQFLEAEMDVRRGALLTFAGYVSRELWKGDQDEWVVILRFKDKAGMDALLEALRTDPHESFRKYGALIDRTTMRVEFAWMQA